MPTWIKHARDLLRELAGMDKGRRGARGEPPAAGLTAFRKGAKEGELSSEEL